MWDKVHDDFVEARGFDTRDPLPGRIGRPMKIPRTLNAEIIKLAAYWNDAWKKLESRRGILGNLPTEQGLDTLKKRWTERDEGRPRDRRGRARSRTSTPRITSSGARAS